MYIESGGIKRMFTEGRETQKPAWKQGRLPRRGDARVEVPAASSQNITTCQRSRGSRGIGECTTFKQEASGPDHRVLE